MKKMIIAIALAYSCFSNAYSWQAEKWYENNSRSIYPGTMRDILIDYSFCRVQEIEAWLKTEKKDLSYVDMEIAKENLKKTLERKNELEEKIKRYYNGPSILQTLRHDANKIAQEKFTSELINSFLIQYKTGKRAEAKIAKRDFYFDCYKLLKNRIWRRY